MPSPRALHPPDGFLARRVGRDRLTIRADCLAHAERLLEARSGGERVGGGRRAHPVVVVPDLGPVVVRSYLRGGLMRHLNRERYFLGHRAMEELVATELARRAGVRVPEVVAAIERPGRLGYRARLATLRIEEARELAGWLAAEPEPEARRSALREVGAQIGRMHAAGIAHPDLNLRNLLLSGAALYLIDFDRARRYPGGVPPRRRRRDLQRLMRSARKLDLRLDAEDRKAMQAGYGVGWPLG